MNLQFVQKIIKDVGVSPTMIKRGLEIYKNNEVKEIKYEYIMDEDGAQFIIINATVKGSKMYKVELELFMMMTKILISKKSFLCQTKVVRVLIHRLIMETGIHVNIEQQY